MQLSIKQVDLPLNGMESRMEAKLEYFKQEKVRMMTSFLKIYKIGSIKNTQTTVPNITKHTMPNIRLARARQSQKEKNR